LVEGFGGIVNYSTFVLRQRLANKKQQVGNNQPALNYPFKEGEMITHKPSPILWKTV